LLRIVVFISGRGSHLKNLIDAQTQGCFKIVGVISDKPEARGLNFAHQANIPIFSKPRSDFPNLTSHKAALYQAAEAFSPDLIALAGFMQIISPDFVERHLGKIVNIHPSLLPALPGLHTHERAIQEKVSQHGCTVHFVDSGVDTGAIIAQAALTVKQNEAVEKLSARVLILEHKLYSWCIQEIARGDISFKNGRVIYTSKAEREASLNNFSIKSEIFR
jgi:phosphoribosylglycinamide formyltransferase-1